MCLQQMLDLELVAGVHRLADPHHRIDGTKHFLSRHIVMLPPQRLGLQ
jgi:hypothetical protein